MDTFHGNIKWSIKGWAHLNHNSLILKKVSFWLTCNKFSFKVRFSSFSLFPKQKEKRPKKFRFFSAKIFQSKATSHLSRKALPQKTKLFKRLRDCFVESSDGTKSNVFRFRIKITFILMKYLNRRFLTWIFVFYYINYYLQCVALFDFV